LIRQPQRVDKPSRGLSNSPQQPLPTPAYH
jgi:hypothetical protein